MHPLPLNFGSLHFDTVFSPHIFMQVKKIMNQVFHDLRGEFELEESYDGRTILGTIMHTIKVQPVVA